MEGGEHKVTGLGCFHAGLHGLAIANLTKEDDVGGFPQDILEALLVVEDIPADFLLGDDGRGRGAVAGIDRIVHVIGILVLDRVLDGDDVFGMILAQPIDQ